MTYIAKNAITLFLVLGLLTGCGGAAERQKKHIEMGQSFFDEQNYEKARLEFKNALQIDPKNAEAHLLLAKTFEKLNNFKRAASEYMAVIQLDDEDVEARSRLARLYIIGRVNDKAGQLVDEIRQRDPDHLGAMLIESSLWAAAGQIDEAIEQLQQVLKIDPANIDAAFLLSGLYTKGNKPEQAIDVLYKALEHDKDNTAMRALLAQLLVEHNKPKQALTLLEQNTKSEPGQLVHVNRLAAVYILDQQDDQAEAILRQFIDNNPQNIQAKLTFVNFLSSRRSPEIAINTLKQFIEKSNDKYELMFHLADLHYALGQKEAAEKIYNDIIEEDSKGPDGISAKVALAKVSFAGEADEQAFKLIEEVLDASPQNRDALVLRAAYSLKMSKPSDAIVDLRTALNANSADIDALKLLARAHMANNEINLALETMDKVVKVRPADVAARIELARLQHQAKLFDRAENNYKNILRLKPDAKQIHIDLIKIQLSQQKTEDARRSLKNFEKIAAADPSVDFFKGLFHQIDGKHELAVNAFKRALQDKPRAIEPLTALVRSYSALKQPSQGKAYLQKLLQQDPDNFFAVYLVGELDLRTGDHAVAVEHFSKAIKLKSDWWVPYSSLAKAHLQQGKKQAALSAYQSGLTATNYAHPIVLELAALYTKQGQYDDSIALYEEALKRGQSSEAINNNLAMSLVTHEIDDADALNRAAELIEGFSSSKNDYYLNTYGWVNLKLGKLDKALPALQRAARRRLDLPTFQYHLAEAYFQSGEYKLARQTLDKAMASEKKFDDQSSALDLQNRLAKAGF